MKPTRHLRAVVGAIACAASLCAACLTPSVAHAVGTGVPEGTFSDDASVAVRTFTEVNGSPLALSADGTLEVVRGADADDHFVIARPGDNDASFQSFTYEADVRVAEHDPSAALVFGIADASNPSASWYGLNFNNESADERVRLFGVRDGAATNYATFTAENAAAVGLDTTALVHLEVSVSADGAFTLSVSNEGEHELTASGTLSDWQGGALGLLTFKSAATFSNVRLAASYSLDDPAAAGLLRSNLGTLATSGGGSYTVNGNGLNVVSAGDVFALASERTFGDLVYSADVKFNERKGAASLVLHAADTGHTYVANLNGETGEARLFKFGDTAGTIDVAPSAMVELNDVDEYHLSVTMLGKHIVYRVNGKVVINTADYTVSNGQAASANASYGQNDAYLEGMSGLLTWQADVSYQNITCTALDESTTPQLAGLSLEGDEVTKNFSFDATNYVYVGYLSNDAATACVRAELPSGAAVTVTDEQGNPQSLEALPLPAIGENRYTLTITNASGEACAVYQLRLFREKPAGQFYNEDWRDQYHFSVKSGWGNDPCGLVRTSDGTWHFLYQQYTDAVWGPMHWGHATSTDLVHWAEQPIALYPDEYGAMYSGCAVTADHATAPSLFAEGESGIVALITANGTQGSDGQRIIAATSSDNGVTWKKSETAGVLIDWSDAGTGVGQDPLNNKDCRDPKVFRYDNRWFMVIAGGPLRIYSSPDLVNWTCESTYAGDGGSLNAGNIWTECPSLYPVEASDGTIKWILNEGGRYYRVGSFGKQANGRYAFVQDSEDARYVMNFGKDSYASMTFFEDGEDFGTSESPKAPQLIAANWMNTWQDGICNGVTSATGVDFNGTYNLFTKPSLTKDASGAWRLAQMPIEQYESLRSENGVVRVVDATVDGSSNPLSDFHGLSYEIVANIRPQSGTPTVGFDVRVGANQKTTVSYDFATKTISIDRSASGVLVNEGSFAAADSQAHVEPNADGSVDLHLYVDRMSVEVFTAGNTVAGANQIFPSPLSDGLRVFSDGADSVANVTVYPLESAWDNDEASTAPSGIGLGMTALYTYVGDTTDVDAWVSPVAASQELVLSSSDEDVATVEQVEGGVRIVSKAAGTATITVASKADPGVSRQLNVTVRINAFKTNVEGLHAQAGTWYVDGANYHVDSAGANSFLMSGRAYELEGLTYDVDVNHADGFVNLVLASQTANPFEGCYAVQIKGDGTLRLFDFKGDATLAEASGVPTPDNGVYRVSMRVNGGVLRVSVNGTEFLAFELAEAGEERAYAEGFVGLGVWDSDATSFANLYVCDAALEQAMKTLDDEIALAEGLSKEDWTSSSWASYQEELTRAREVFASRESTLEQLESAYAKLQQARGGLVATDEPGGGEQCGSGDQDGSGDQGGSDEQGGSVPGGSGEQMPGATSPDGSSSGAVQASDDGGRRGGRGTLPQTSDVSVSPSVVSGMALAGAVLVGVTAVARKVKR